MNNTNMKKAVVDQIILWIVLFTIFVSFLFFIIDYSNAMKVKDNTDAIADYIGRMVALNKNEADIIAGVNEVKDDYFVPAQVADLICNTDNTVLNHQVIINVQTTIINSFIPVGANNVHSKTVVFNESSESQKECFLILSFN
jgi:Flp pilus assembly protein TadG